MNKTVVYFGSREIYGDFYTAIRSLLAHTDCRVITITEDPDPFYDLPVHNIVYKAEWFNELNLQTKWRKFGPIRAAFTKILPEYDLVLSLDVDPIVEKDVSALFDIDMTDYYFAACKETKLSEPGRPYWNNGVCLMNLKKIREDKKDDQMIHALNTESFRYVGQDVMTRYLDKVLELPSDYNVCQFTAPTRNVIIRHYANRTDWRDLPEVTQYKSYQT